MNEEKFNKNLMRWAQINDELKKPVKEPSGCLVWLVPIIITTFIKLLT